MYRKPAFNLTNNKPQPYKPYESSNNVTLPIAIILLIAVIAERF